VLVTGPGWSLEADRRLLDHFMPGLRERLAAFSLSELERPRGPGIEAFRAAGGAALLVPTEHKGAGAGAVDAVRVQRALGSLAPSLAVAATMHHFSVATLAEMAAGNGSGLEWVMLQAVAQTKLLVASGFAEGKPGQHIFKPTLRGRKTADGAVIDGSKKPCSLTWSMDLLTASVLISQDGHPDRTAVAMIPAKTPGVDRRRFWAGDILAGAESDEVILTGVHVPDRLLIFPQTQELSRDRYHIRGFIWFEALISASYLGIASALADRVFAGRMGTPTGRVELAVDLEGARYALLRLATVLDEGGADEAGLAEALLVRYSTQRAVMRTAAAAAEYCGGMSFATAGDSAYLLAASRALAFHPPSYSSAVPSLDDYLGGAEFVLN
jgi:alkylation response protein AidB-like acyl-CoA dehydrogenase